jgi:formylglycine-generating enzyme required for sulfatase activity
MKRLLILSFLTLFLAAGLEIQPAQAAIKEFQQPNAYAVVIGIGQYREEVIPKVAYAVQDAQAIAGLLETQAGIPKTHIKVLTDARATLSDLRNHLGDWLRMRVKADSTVYVYYAGHGTPNLQTQSGAIVPWDGHPDFPSGLYPLKELEDTLSKLPTKNVVVFLDSCFSGGAGRSVIAKGARPMGLQYPVLSQGEVMVLAAATGTQISSDYDKAGHGLFTHYLLAGLQGEADADKDGIVTLKEITPFVRDRVAHTAVEELNREQTPVLLPGAEQLGKRDTLPLARAGSAKPAATVAAGGASDEVAKLKQELDALKQQMAKPAEIPKPIEVAKAYSTPQLTDNQIVGKDGAPMMLVPAGEFLYGEKNERVTLPIFYMDKFEVTTKLYAAFMQATGYAQPNEWSKQVALMGSGDRPVGGVTWKHADAYCRYYGKRLPTEQELEKSARGTDGRTYPWGNEAPTSRHGLFEATWKGYETLPVVGSHEAGASPYGIHDLSGNGFRWTSSDYDNSGKTKVVRGGPLYGSANVLRATNRGDMVSTTWAPYLSFRCAQDSGKSEPSSPAQLASAKPYASLQPSGNQIIGKDGAPMVLVPAGEFLYGEKNERLSLPAFYMDKFEVTTKLYSQFLQATSRRPPDYWDQVNLTNDGDRPVVGVDWYDVDGYCRHYSKRLPTEQEWEKAARGTDGRKYPWGDNQPSSHYANYGKPNSNNVYKNRLASVGTYEAGKSPYGLYDMVGNVWEWTSSGGSRKVLRGGAWHFVSDFLHASYNERSDFPPTFRADSMGFRCAQDAPK